MIFLRLLKLTSSLAILAGCTSVPPDECEQALEFPLELTAYIQGIGGIVDADMLPSICLDK